MKKVWKEIKYWSQIFLLPVYGLSFLMPRSKRIWVFGSTFGHRFADNPKYLYLYVSQVPNDSTKAIWISKDRDIVNSLVSQGLPAYYLYTPKGIWHCLRAGVYIYDNYSKDVCFLLSGGAKKFNLWHGIPLKKINKDNLFDYVRNPRSKREKVKWALRRVQDEKPSHYVLTTSEFLRPIFSSAFHTKKVMISGYPRNDALGNMEYKQVASQDELALLEELQCRKDKDIKTTVFYMPTFRDSETGFFDVMDLDSFHEFLKENHMLFCVKLHPKSRIKQHLSKFLYDNIILIDSQYDPYPFLKLADRLVTDYSSIYFDFLLTDRPVIFFPYDLKQYLEGSRDMYFDYDAFTPGEKVIDQNSLEKALLAEDTYRKFRGSIRSKVFDDIGQCASEQLYYRIKGEPNHHE